jgi:uncharacterized protein (DUF2267 family)
MVNGKHSPGSDANNAGEVIQIPFNGLEDEVSIERIKKIAAQLKDPLRSLILSEPTRMTRREYAVKVGQWLKLLELEEK